MVVPSVKPTLICTIWTEKLYNLESFKAQMRSIWNTNKKFEIQTVGQNLYLITFELEEDLELIMEGRPWLSQIRLHLSPFWLKIGHCLPEFDKKDLLHAIGVTFGGVLRSEICGEWCRLKINLNVQKPLRRGIFVSIDNSNKWWISFKYEKLLMFCFSCGRVGHGLSDCSEWNPAEKIKIKKDPPYTLALKAESNVIGKESIKFNNFSKKTRAQCSYTRSSEMEAMNGIIQWGLQSSGEEKLMEEQKKVSTDMKDEQMDEIKNRQVINLNLAKKTSWRRDISNQSRAQPKDESSIKKRKANEDEVEIGGIEEVYEDIIKRLKKDRGKICGKMLTEVMINEMDQSDVRLLMRSAAAKRQADREQ
ncbi:hypothetical protein Goshw_007921 [Gossypium schwendimanii]|uniref:CCHC-type domain-containing protein n=1 Tax=Gossypium schwendimanii TaxID=34291 RepID=A0A7J9MSC9_GOSSC|nr:hypothetical protein [Gossypium schwendimanii]